MTVFRWSPRSCHEFRSMLLRSFGAKIGKGVHVYPRAQIWAPWNLELGDRVGIANGVILYNQGRITIGTGAVVSQGSHLCGGTHDYEKDGMPLLTMPIVVGDYAWITAEVFVHPGVNVGEGAVIGARSVVTKDLPAWSVCAGHPCRLIKQRYWRPGS